MRTAISVRCRTHPQALFTSHSGHIPDLHHSTACSAMPSPGPSVAAKSRPRAAAAKPRGAPAKSRAATVSGKPRGAAATRSAAVAKPRAAAKRGAASARSRVSKSDQHVAILAKVLGIRPEILRQTQDAMMAELAASRGSASDRGAAPAPKRQRAAHRVALAQPAASQSPGADDADAPSTSVGSADVGGTLHPASDEPVPCTPPRRVAAGSFDDAPGGAPDDASHPQPAVDAVPSPPSTAATAPGAGGAVRRRPAASGPSRHDFIRSRHHRIRFFHHSPTSPFHIVHSNPVTNASQPLRSTAPCMYCTIR